MEKVIIRGYNYGIEKGTESYPVGEKKLICLAGIEKHNKPLYIRNQYGKGNGCKDVEKRFIYPPYKLVEYDPGEVDRLGRVVLEASKVERIGIVWNIVWGFSGSMQKVGVASTWDIEEEATKECDQQNEFNDNPACLYWVEEVEK